MCLRLYRSQSQRWTGAILAVSASLLLAGAARCDAGTISFRIDSTVDHANGVRLSLTLTNLGDESAYAVTPRARIGDASAAGEALEKLEPRASHSWVLPIRSEALSPGAYVIVTRVAYQDANEYPFEVLATTPIAVNVQRKPAIGGTFAVANVDSTEEVGGELVLQRPPSRGQRYKVEMLAPSGLAVRPRERSVTFGDKRDLVIRFRLRNRNLLPGSRLNISALVTSLDEDPVQTDTVGGTVAVTAAAPLSADHGLFATIAVIALIALAAVVSWLQRRGGVEAIGPVQRRIGVVAELVLALVPCAFLLYTYPWPDLLARTTTAGGDMASLYYPTTVMAKDLLPNWQITGWTMGNYAGFPIFQFYSTLPFVVVALLGKVFPMEVVFKLATLLGPTLLPLAAAYLFVSLGYGRGAAAMAAASVLPFLFQQGNSMWGGNLPSVLAGEFCHSIGISLSLVFLGVLHRAVRGKGSWPAAALLLAAIGLCHTFAFLAAVWYSLFFLWPRRDARTVAPPVLAAYAIAFLLLCFWGLPLPARLKFTTEWSMIWRIKSWTEVVPAPLWPASVLTAANLLVMLVSAAFRWLSARRGNAPRSRVFSALADLKPFERDRQGLLLFVLAGMALLYFLVPAIGFPDIRFIPIAQIFLGLMAADFLYWAGRRIQVPLPMAVAVVVGVCVWTQSNIGYVPSWLKWNYSGYEGKPTWPLFKQINDHLRGDRNDPRVVFEHSQIHNRFGSSRAFENLPLFAGRSTLEGVFHQASVNSPFIFYTQSEVSERGSGPFGQYTYTRLNPALALPHLRLYNVNQIVAVSDAAKKAYDEAPDFHRSLTAAPYAVYDIVGGGTGYVEAARNTPVLFEGHDWKLAFYRWFKHPELLDIPVVPADLVDREANDAFKLRTDTVRRLPRIPYDGDCRVQSHLEQERITFDTSCPGRPHIVKVSYFPRWHASDGSPVQLVSPGFMLVYPSASHFEMVYRRNAIDWLALSLTFLGIAVWLWCVFDRRTADRIVAGITRSIEPALETWGRHALWIGLALVLVGSVAGAATRLTLRAPDKEYSQAQRAYQARDFQAAITLLRDWTQTDRDTFKQATALYQLGVSHSELDHHVAAVQVLERLRFEFPNVNYGAATLFHLARNYAALGDLDKARNVVAELRKEAPDSQWLQRLAKEHPEIL